MHHPAACMSACCCFKQFDFEAAFAFYSVCGKEMGGGGFNVSTNKTPLNRGCLWLYHEKVSIPFNPLSDDGLFNKGKKYKINLKE